MRIRHGCHALIFPLVLLSAILFSSGLEARSVRTEVRVRLKKQIDSLEISGFALRVSPANGYMAADFAGELNSVRIKKKNPGVWSLEWPSGRVQRLEGARLYVRGQMLRVGLEPVPYDLELVESDNKGFDVVARMELDKYLLGVLPSEMPLSWPIEALKAQAVAARSYALRTMVERRYAHYDVESTVIDQVYKFSEEHTMRPDWARKLGTVLEETRGEVLTDDQGRALKAFYHADCGCQTEDPKFVWGASKFFESVKDPTCKFRKTHSWNLALTKDEVRSKLTEHFNLPLTANLRDLNIVSRTPSGRVALLAANFLTEGDRKVSYTLNAQIFRKLFGFQKVASSNFTIQKTTKEFQIDGQGLGHGVGLCQWGAKALALNGSSYRDILKSFYPRAYFKSPKAI